MTTPFLDCFYSAIFLPGITAQSALRREVKEVALQLYAEHQNDLTALFNGKSPTLKQWSRLVESMVIHPEEEDGGLIISVRATGSADGQHSLIAEWVATRLLGKAPRGSKVLCSRITNAVGEAPGTSSWVTLNEQGDRLVPALFL